MKEIINNNYKINTSSGNPVITINGQILDNKNKSYKDNNYNANKNHNI